MTLFGGPSKAVLLQMSQGIASVAMQITFMNQMNDEERIQMQENMRREGTPTSMKELVYMAAEVINEQSMGWYKKNQFLGMIYGSLVAMGMPPRDANYIKGQIELIAK